MKFVLHKIGEICLSIFLLIFLTFIILRLLPGGPYDEDIALHPLVRENLEQSWSLHSHFFQQFGSYLISTLKFEFGYSLSYPGRTVGDLILQKMKYSFALQSFAITFILIVTMMWAYFDFRSRRISFYLDEIGTIFLSLPALFIGPLLIYLFGFYFPLLPVAFLTSPSHFILPVLIMSLRSTAFLSRIQVVSQRELEKSEFVRFARAKGLTEKRIYFAHILKNSLPVTLSALPSLLTGILSGSFLVEMLLSIPGMGLLFVEAISSRDYPLILGVTLFLGILMICLSEVFRYLSINMDPRLSEEKLR